MLQLDDWMCIGVSWRVCASSINMQRILALYGVTYSLCVGGCRACVYVHVCVCVSVRESPSQWVGSVLLVLVQWARPCIRQVELQGEFCNTWPVSLSHLCGWRKRGEEEHGAGEVGEGSASGSGWLEGWVTMKSDCEREREQQLGEPEGGKMRWQCLHISSFLLSLSLSLSLIHPSHPCPSFSRPGWVAPLLITHPFNLKGRKHKLSTLNARISNFFYVTVAACYWRSCTCTVPLSVCLGACVLENIWCQLST